METQYNIIFGEVSAIPLQEQGVVKISGIINVYIASDPRPSDVTEEEWNNATNKTTFNGVLQIKRAQNNFSGSLPELVLLAQQPLSLKEGQNVFSYIDTSAAIGEELAYQLDYRFKELDESNTTESDESNIITTFFSAYKPVDISNIILISDDIILTTKDTTLRIRYNPEVSSFKKNVVDVITPTLGGRYPQVRRNSNQQYYSFNISGLISISIEESDIFDNEAVRCLDSIYHENEISPDTNTYKDSMFLPSTTSSEWSNSFGKIETFYNNGTISKADYVALMERTYRDKVYNFLYAPKIKLFKSLQEGSFFVYLSNISLTAEKTSNRVLYSFSCQATEVEPTNAENYFNHFTIDNGKWGD